MLDKPKLFVIIKTVIITILGDTMKNFSRQREEIIKVLRSTDTHPTAAWVYSRVKEVIPNISLGTVYRNLAALSESGEILSLSVGDGFEHFDGNPAPHAHLHCRRCGKIADAPMRGDPLALQGNTGLSRKPRFISNTVFVKSAKKKNNLFGGIKNEKVCMSCLRLCL